MYVNVDRTGGYYAELNKPIRERQLSYCFTHMQNTRIVQRTITEEGKTEREKIRERKKNHKRLLTLENKLRVAEGVMGRRMQ